jgi:hypothetical protein
MSDGDRGKSYTFAMTSSKPKQPTQPSPDAVLRRMLGTPPKPHKSEPAPRQPEQKKAGH